MVARRVPSLWSPRSRAVNGLQYGSSVVGTRQFLYSCSAAGVGLWRTESKHGRKHTNDVNLQGLISACTGLIAGFFRDDCTMMVEPSGRTEAGHSGHRAFTAAEAWDPLCSFPDAFPLSCCVQRCSPDFHRDLLPTTSSYLRGHLQDNYKGCLYSLDESTDSRQLRTQNNVVSYPKQRGGVPKSTCPLPVTD
jgi:hypothetical protein